MTAACANPWHCIRLDVHEGGASGRGCIHIAAWAPDRHGDDRCDQ